MPHELKNELRCNVQHEKKGLGSRGEHLIHASTDNQLRVRTYNAGYPPQLHRFHIRSALRLWTGVVVRERRGELLSAKGPTRRHATNKTRHSHCRFEMNRMPFIARQNAISNFDSIICAGLRPGASHTRTGVQDRMQPQIGCRMSSPAAWIQGYRSISRRVCLDELAAREEIDSAESGHHFHIGQVNQVVAPRPLVSVRKSARRVPAPPS